jgi:hypothetical protein
MKTCIKNKCTKTAALLLTVLLTVFTSCSDIYDNITEYVKSKKVYADKLDGIIRVQVGYERVEIDLMRAGRIPASQISMGKAKKTVIECEDFTEPDHRRVIDSVCSWVNISGLTQLKTYQFTIYTEDEFGNRSMPLIAAARPYTSENRDALDLLPPVITESTSAALLEWKDRLSYKVYDFFRYRYEYTGVFFGKKYDPAKNSVYVSATQGMEIRKELTDTEVEVLGEMPDVIQIYQVINLQTKVADGTLTRGRNAEIEGSYIKVTGDDPTVGVYLESVDGSVLYKLDADLIVVNNPSKLLLLIPAEWQPGVYRLKVVTQYTGAGKQLNAPRQAVFGRELMVI